MKILVAEDDRLTRLLLTRALTGWGYEVVAAADGEEAWEALSRDGIRLVVSDWEMPRLEGPGLCRRIRAQSSSYVYVLLLTAHKDAARIVEGLEAGADDFVSKPFEPNELRARLGVGRRILTLQDDLAQKFAELERANRQLALIAAIDPLMNIGNRRSFEEAISRVAGPTAADYGILMIDVDHFKEVNDRYGHATGDRVLSAIAGTLQQTKASSDEIFRWGGEEIIMIAPRTTTRALEAIGERLRAAVAGLRIERETGEALQVSASFGGAVVDRPGLAWAQVVARADEALYEAKKAGRNRVVIRAEAPGGSVQ